MGIPNAHGQERSKEQFCGLKTQYQETTAGFSAQTSLHKWWILANPKGSQQPNSFWSSEAKTLPAAQHLEYTHTMSSRQTKPDHQRQVQILHWHYDNLWMSMDRTQKKEIAIRTWYFVLWSRQWSCSHRSTKKVKESQHWLNGILGEKQFWKQDLIPSLQIWQ